MPLPAMSKEERHDEEGHIPLLIASKQQERNKEGYTPPRRVKNETKTRWGGGMPLPAMPIVRVVVSLSVGDGGNDSILYLL